MKHFGRPLKDDLIERINTEQICKSHVSVTEYSQKVHYSDTTLRNQNINEDLNESKETYVNEWLTKRSSSYYTAHATSQHSITTKTNTDNIKDDKNCQVKEEKNKLEEYFGVHCPPELMEDEYLQDFCKIVTKLVDLRVENRCVKKQVINPSNKSLVRQSKKQWGMSCSTTTSSTSTHKSEDSNFWTNITDLLDLKLRLRSPDDVQFTSSGSECTTPTPSTVFYTAPSSTESSHTIRQSSVITLRISDSVKSLRDKNIQVNMDSNDDNKNLPSNISQETWVNTAKMIDVKLDEQFRKLNLKYRNDWDRSGASSRKSSNISQNLVKEGQDVDKTEKICTTFSSHSKKDTTENSKLQDNIKQKSSLNLINKEVSHQQINVEKSKVSLHSNEHVDVKEQDIKRKSSCTIPQIKYSNNNMPTEFDKEFSVHSKENIVKNNEDIIPSKKPSTVKEYPKDFWNNISVMIDKELHSECISSSNCKISKKKDEKDFWESMSDLINSELNEPVNSQPSLGRPSNGSIERQEAQEDMNSSSSKLRIGNSKHFSKSILSLIDVELKNRSSSISQCPTNVHETDSIETSCKPNKKYSKNFWKTISGLINVELKYQRSAHHQIRDPANLNVVYKTRWTPSETSSDVQVCPEHHEIDDCEDELIDQPTLALAEHFKKTQSLQHFSKELAKNSQTFLDLKNKFREQLQTMAKSKPVTTGTKHKKPPTQDPTENK